MCQAPTVPTLPRAEREAMMAQAEKLVQWQVRKSGPAYLFDDLCQDILLQVWQSFGRYDPTKSQWQTYVVGLAKMILRRRNCDATSCPVLDAFGSEPRSVDRTVYERMADVIAASGTEPEEEPDAEEALATDVCRAIRDTVTEPLLAALTPLGRAAVEPIVRDGVTPAQVADRLGVSVKDVKLHIRNAARRLACRFEEIGVATGITRRPASGRKSPTKRERLEGQAIALLAEVGPNASEIARRLGVSAGLLKWPAFRKAFDTARAVAAVPASPPPAPVAAAPAPPARAFTCRGWTFAKRLAPWTAKKLIARRR